MRRKSLLARLRRHLQREDGVAVTTPILTLGSLVLFMIVLQLGFWFISNNVAQTAANAAYTSARGYQSDADAGRDAAWQLLNGLGSFLPDATVDVTRTGESVTVTVTGNTRAVLPGVPLPAIAHTVTGPVERWEPAP